MKRVNIIIGRFQPITKGHMKCVEEAWSKAGAPTVLCMIETSKAKVGPRHPFPSDILLPLYKELFGHNKMVQDIVLVHSADIVKIGETLADMDYKIASWTCGTDRMEAYTRMAKNYKTEAGLAEDFRIIEVVRGDEDISATKLREAIRRDDYKVFTELFPTDSITSGQSKRIYKKLRTQLLTISEHTSLAEHLKDIIIEENKH